MSKPIHIDWIAKNALDGMMQLGPWEELAYRRIIDMIYASDDNLLDNDESLKWSTKTGTKWPGVKKTLLAMGKIEVVDGRITHPVCREKLTEAHERINAAREAGIASAEARKQRKNNETAPTGVGTDVITEWPTGFQPITNYQLPSSEDKSSSERPARKKNKRKPEVTLAEWEAEHGRITPEQLAGFAEKHRAPPELMAQLVERFRLKCGAKGYTYRDFLQAFQSWDWEDALAKQRPAEPVSGEITRTISRSEYDRAIRLLPDAPDKRKLQAVIEAYKQQNTGQPIRQSEKHEHQTA